MGMAWQLFLLSLLTPLSWGFVPFISFNSFFFLQPNGHPRLAASPRRCVSPLSMCAEGPRKVRRRRKDAADLEGGGELRNAQEEKDPPGRVDMDQLEADVMRYRAAKDSTVAEEDEGGILSGVSDTISWILFGDFLVVLGFLLWFIAGVGLKATTQDSFLIDKFTDSWNGLIQPALGVLMAGTILGGTVGKMGEDSD
ncbi:unnamed protein product [Chrysoparadoxa australica]